MAWFMIDEDPVCGCVGVFDSKLQPIDLSVLGLLLQSKSSGVQRKM